MLLPLGSVFPVHSWLGEQLMPVLLQTRSSSVCTLGSFTRLKSHLVTAAHAVSTNAVSARAEPASVVAQHTEACSLSPLAQFDRSERQLQQGPTDCTSAASSALQRKCRHVAQLPVPQQVCRAQKQTATHTEMLHTALLSTFDRFSCAAVFPTLPLFHTHGHKTNTNIGQQAPQVPAVFLSTLAAIRRAAIAAPSDPACFYDSPRPTHTASMSVPTGGVAVAVSLPPLLYRNYSQPARTAHTAAAPQPELTPESATFVVQPPTAHQLHETEHLTPLHSASQPAERVVPQPPSMPHQGYHPRLQPVDLTAITVNMEQPNHTVPTVQQQEASPVSRSKRRGQRAKKASLVTEQQQQQPQPQQPQQLQHSQQPQQQQRQQQQQQHKAGNKVHRLLHVDATSNSTQISGVIFDDLVKQRKPAIMLKVAAQDAVPFNTLAHALDTATTKAEQQQPGSTLLSFIIPATNKRAATETGAATNTGSTADSFYVFTRLSPKPSVPIPSSQTMKVGKASDVGSARSYIRKRLENENAAPLTVLAAGASNLQNALTMIMNVRLQIRREHRDWRSQLVFHVHKVTHKYSGEQNDGRARLVYFELTALLCPEDNGSHLENYSQSSS